MVQHKYGKVIVIIMKQIFVNNIGTSYYITENGKCYNNITNKWLKGQINYKNGYKSYSLTLPDGSKKRLYAHRLVANAYIPKSDNKKNQISHIDGNKENNCVDNLAWITKEESQRLESKKHNHVFCFTKDKRLVAEYKTIAEASQAISVSYSIILQELKKERKALSGGFYWSDKPVLEETIEYKSTSRAKEVNQYDLNGKYIMSYPSTGIAAKAIRGKRSRIGECCRGKIETYKGYIWRYVEDIVSPLGESPRE